ncbi:hypothetical protein [Hymenobacter elongatus]|uniref:Uncharacterized protein n=1 Tax=Hymenobacter elongatus TaxID=877208 RepID=A0A4Z0PFS6_9BACT|nr:hypothetical protein [Hymenobacter elongatus]TGE13926.1 hypothetical protein E5J99_18200 [Hymenobacter elongatus]
MRTPTSYSDTDAAVVRRHFALTQAELARWLQVSARQVEAVEASRRQFSPAVSRRLSQLQDLLRAPGLSAPETLPVPPPPLPAYQATHDAQVLRRRLRRCQHLAYQLQYQLETLALQDTALLRRRQGLAALRQALATPGAMFDPVVDPTEAEVWLTHLEANTAAVLRPGPLARAHLVLRHRLLLEEAQELTRLLGMEESGVSS